MTASSLPARDQLGALAAAWRRRWLAGAAVAAGAAGLLVAAGLARLGSLPATPAGLGGAAAAVAAFALAAAVRRRVDATAVARHLDRTVPALEDSAELLLGEAANLSPLPRLQQQRAAAALARAAPQLRLPHRPFTLALRLAAALLLVAAALALWPARGRPGIAPSTTPAGPAAPAAPTWQTTAVRVIPPAYTGHSSRTARGWDLEGVEEGAVLRWHIGTAGVVDSLLLATTNGDTARGADPILTARHATLYTVTAFGPGGTVTSDYHRLLVTPDQAPTVAVVQPDLRTVVPPTASPRVDLEVLANDDYGLSETVIVATVTTGQGEGVKFREQELAFAARERRAGGGVRLRATLDLATLGMAPGDELYFHIRARDNRLPAHNESRSATHFVALADTAAARVADFSGLGVNLLPEYFRSQRQIIIDTERLLRERAGLGMRTFRDRAQNIGLDQHALRLRYGAIVGDELEDSEDEVDLAERHEHDTEENATRLATTVKATLKRALNEMWQAELYLRTYDPQAALPYEYRALEFLKQVQQAARVYVQRVGFEPPPIEVDRLRLTGELRAVASRSRTGDRPPALPYPAIRAGLAALDAARPPADAATITTLETAGRELAALAVHDPVRHLAALRDLRTLLDALANGAPCADCVPRVRRGLLQALPAPEASAAPAPATGRGSAQAYFDLLREFPQ